MLRSKRLSLGITLLAVLSTTLATMGPTATAGNVQRTAAVKAGKTGVNAPHCKQRNKATATIKLSDWQFPDTLNVYQTQEFVSSEVTLGMIHGLFAYTAKLKLIPVLAAQIPSIKNGGIQNGGKTIVIHLKKGIRWSNGAEITSQDVKFGWLIDSDKATGPLCESGCNAIGRIDTPDKYTAVLHMKRTYAPAIPLAMPDVWPRKWGSDWNNNPSVAAQKLGQDKSFNFEGPNFPTNGPYQVVSFIPNDRIVLHPMKYYNVMSCGGYIQNLIFASYSSKGDLIAAAARQDTDVTRDYTFADLAELNKYKSVFGVYVTPSFTLERLELMIDPTYNGKPNPLADANVRVALALTLDRIGLIRSALSLSQPQARKVVAWTPWVNLPGLVQPYTNTTIQGQWDPVIKKFVIPGTPQALADAKKLLARTAYKSGFSLDFFTTAGNPVRQAQEAVAAANWSKIGVTVNANYITAGKLVGDYQSGGILAHGAFQVAMFKDTVDPDPDYLKTSFESKYIDRFVTVHSNVNGNYSGIKDKVIDRGFEAGARTFNKKARYNAYSAVQLELNKLAYWIPLYFLPTIATADNHVTNFQPNPTNEEEWNLYAWQPKGKG